MTTLPTSAATPSLLDAMAAETATATARRKALNESAKIAPVSTLVPGEQDETTYVALAELYDGKRNRAVEQLAGIVGGYGNEMEKRSSGIGTENAGQLLVEMRRLLDAADAAHARAKSHRAAAK